VRSITKRVRRGGLVAFVLLALAGVAALIVSGSGAQEPLGPRVIAVASARLTVADPLGGPRWRIEHYRRGPLSCVTARRLMAGRPRHNVGIGGCTDMRSGKQLIASSWAGSASRPRTLVLGYARAGVRRVTITGPGGSRTFELSKRGRVFLAVFAGRVDSREIGVGTTMGNGTHKLIALTRATTVYAADPGHGTPWTADANRFAKGPRRGQTCVHVWRVQPRFGPALKSRSIHMVCADLKGTPFFFRILSTHGRTMLVGAAGRTVTGVQVRVAGQTRDVPVASRGRTFFAVFDRATVSPYDPTVVIHKRTGTNMFRGQLAANVTFLRKGRQTQFAVRPSEGTMTTPFSVWFKPPRPIDNNLDSYSASLTGPGGAQCRRRFTWATGITWNPRYNARNSRRGTAIGFPPRRTLKGSLVPDAWETWCPGTYKGVLRFLDAPKGQGGRTKPRDLVHFRFTVRSFPGSFRYHGRTISPDAAARHHLKCSSDRAICDDSMAALMRDIGKVPVDEPMPQASEGRCPATAFDPLTPDAVVGVRRAVLDQASRVYRGTNLEGMRIVKVAHAPRDRDRGGYARVKCGAKGWRRTYVVYLDFPAMRPSASLSQGVVLVGRFRGDYRIWAQLH
jgi:hypothetical protein